MEFIPKFKPTLFVVGFEFEFVYNHNVKKSLRDLAEGYLPIDSHGLSASCFTWVLIVR